jgi:two-component system, NtrC family, response regulator GlrR
MSIYRCAVVAAGASSQYTGAAFASIASLPGFAVIDDLRADCELDAFVLAASPGAMAEVLDRIATLRRDRPDCAVLVCGEGFNLEQMTALFTAGAHDLVAVAASASELGARLKRSLGLSCAAPPVARVVPGAPRDFIGQSPAFARQIARLPAIAGCDAGVLILGETGTGKEVCAQAIHYMSPRASRPWIAVNCGAIPLELVESELFGHVRGAYTTAHTAREGLVAEAQGGTLFLDDIDCLPLAAQSKLLRFLQEREYRPVGANAVRRCDVRVIAASNRDLATLAVRGTFRQDLYFRLDILTLTLPPLRARREDIPALAAHFVELFARRFGRRPPVLSPRAVRKLTAYDWPGNVRELQHVIERSILLASGPVLAPGDIEIASDVPLPQGDESFRAAKARVVQDFERQYIEHLLATCDGNVTHAAHEAKKNRRAFFELIRKHGIELQRFRSTK